MSIKENWLAGAFGFILGRATAPVPGPAAPAYQPPAAPIRMPQSEEERRADKWRAFAPLDEDVFLVQGTDVSEFPRIFPQLGRHRMDGYRADYLYWLDADTYCFPQPDGWGWEVSEPTTDMAELEQGLRAKSAAPRPTSATWKWGVLPERALPEHALGGEGLLWHPDDDPMRLLPAGWAESYSFICQ
jgi:hypothetical protein